VIFFSSQNSLVRGYPKIPLMLSVKASSAAKGVGRLSGVSRLYTSTVDGTCVLRSRRISDAMSFCAGEVNTSEML
jgi:hypothetical protein